MSNFVRPRYLLVDGKNPHPQGSINYDEFPIRSHSAVKILPRVSYSASGIRFPQSFNGVLALENLTVPAKPLKTRLAETETTYAVSRAFLVALAGVREHSQCLTEHEQYLLRVQRAHVLHAEGELSRDIVTATGLSPKEVDRVIGGTHPASKTLTAMLRGVTGQTALHVPYVFGVFRHAFEKEYRHV